MSRGKGKIFRRFFKKIDIFSEMEYNGGMEKIQIAIIGGGASGLILAATLEGVGKTVLFERGDRVGRKLSATGNGQGNITNLSADETEYFSSEKSASRRAGEIVSAYGQEKLRAYFRSLGVLLTADDRGRVYPAGRQASALTDALRFRLREKGVDVRLSSRVADMERTEDGFVLTVEQGAEKQKLFAEKVVLCAGGKAAKNFGTDGSAYALARKFGHTVTPLFPSLVQLKTDTAYTKALKGVRINDGGLTALLPAGERISLRGDIIFTDYGVSGDAVFRISAYIADKLPSGKVRLSLDLLPAATEEEILAALRQKRAAFPALADGELLFGILNNQVGRVVMKRAGGDI